MEMILKNKLALFIYINIIVYYKKMLKPIICLVFDYISFIFTNHYLKLI